ncbi:transcriptional regulator [Croceimicrobium sp.]|uniref:transcriptional regulator n=1 Tax=Croceimicrobium sp. TaxID=2828340 RepID=UPI003BABDDC5
MQFITISGRACLKKVLLLFCIWSYSILAQSETDAIERLRANIYSQPAHSYVLADSLLKHSKPGPELEVELWNLKAGAAWLEGRLSQSSKDYVIGIQLADKLGFPEAKIRMEGNLANVFNDLGAYRLAKNYYKKGFNTLIHANSLLNIATVYLREKQLDSAQYFLDKALNEYQSQASVEGQALCHSNYARLYLARSMWSKARYHLHKSDSLFEGGPNIKMQLTNEIIAWNLKLKDKPASFNATGLRNSLAKCQSSSFRELARDAHALLYEWFRGQNSDSALSHLRAKLHLDSSLTGNQDRNITMLVENFYQAQLKLENLRNEKEELRMHELLMEETYARQKLILSLMFLVMIGLGLGLYIQQKTKNLRLSQRMRQVENEKLNQEVQHQRKMHEEQAKLIHFKEKELLSYSLKEAQLRQEFQDLRTKIQEGHSSNDLLRIVKGAQRKWDSWENFNRHFQSVHQDFFKALSKEHALSSKELRISALSVLGLSAKEMSEILGIKPSSVDIARHRLKKKLDLEPDLSLTEYLRKFIK